MVFIGHFLDCASHGVVDRSCVNARDFTVFVFFFSSRRRHTRSLRDWFRRVLFRSPLFGSGEVRVEKRLAITIPAGTEDGTRSEERRVGKSVDLGGRRSIKKKKKSREGVGVVVRKVSAASPDVLVVIMMCRGRW